MKILDVTPFQEGLARNQETLTRIQEEMDAIRTAAQQLSDLGDSLTGEGGESIKAFYRECHLPLLETFANFKNTFASTMNSIKSSQETLESAPDGYIMESFLEGEVDTGLTTISTTTSNLTSDANGIMDSVADIVALPHLDDSEVQEGVRDARKKKEDTVTDLNEFDSTQTNSLTSIENDILRMELWVLDLEGAMQDGLSPVDFPEEDWAAFAEIHPLNTGQNSVPMETETVEDKEESGESGDVNQTEAGGVSHTDVKSTVGWLKRIRTGAEGGISAFGLYQAQKHGLYGMTKPVSGGGSGYRIVATRKALEALGVNIDADANRQLNKNLPKNPNKKWKDFHHQAAATNTAYLKFATKKQGTSGWSTVGEEVLAKHPSLAYFNDEAGLMQKSKTIGMATLKGAGKSFKDIVDVKGISQEFKKVKSAENAVGKGGSLLKGAGKALGPIGAGVSYYSNYQNAEEEGLTGGQAHAKAAKDTAIETAVGGAVQAASVAVFTAAVPIPGVGTAIGVGVGIVANTLLNKKFGGDEKSEGKSAMDIVKGWFH